MPYFVNPKLNFVIEGPQKRFSPVTGFDLLSKTGNAYAARKNGMLWSLQEDPHSAGSAELIVRWLYPAQVAGRPPIR